LSFRRFSQGLSSNLRAPPFPQIGGSLHKTIHDDDGFRAAGDPANVVRPGKPQEDDDRKSDNDDWFHVP
jgi:hypothetical protein